MEIHEGNLWRLTIAAVAVTLLYQLGYAIYNLYFHPLAVFPGPASSAAFYLPDFWSLYKGSIHNRTRELHGQYGDVVRVRPNQLSFTSAQAWKDIYGSRTDKGQMQKDQKFYQFPGQTRTNIIYSNDADHTRMRKLLSHAFSDAALRSQEDILNHYFDLFIESLSRQCAAGQTVDLTRWYNYFTFDVIGSLCFGEDFDALRNGEYHSWMSNVFQGIKMSRLFYIVSYYSIAFDLLKGVAKLRPSLRKANEEHELFSKLKTAKRLEMKTDRKDFMTYILRYNDERGMSESEIEHTTSVLIVAGSETTATLLSGATFLMLSNPAVYERAKAEVRAAFSTPQEMTLASTARLPYLHALLEEGLRLYPPVPIALPRVTGKEGDWIAGHYVPPHTSVGIPHWTVNTSGQHWANPEVFAPERWLEKPPEIYAGDNKAIMNPFSAGPRNCIGKNLAYNEMRSAMARMLWHFDMELTPGHENWRDQAVYILWEKPALNVKLTFAKR